MLNSKIFQLEMQTTAESGTGAAMETNRSLHFCGNVCKGFFVVVVFLIPLLFGRRDQENMWDSNGTELDPTIRNNFLSWTQ